MMVSLTHRSYGNTLEQIEESFGESDPQRLKEASHGRRRPLSMNGAEN
jgi:hypothetical protein